MRQKKAALELSVTAIVVLILAIVMLGLGLGFVRGMFGRVSTTFDEQIATEPEPPKATAAEPITLSRETIVTHADDSEVLKIMVYNPTSTAAPSVTPGATCSTGTYIAASPAPQIYGKVVASGETETFNYLFTVGSVIPGSSLCAVSAAIGGTTYTKDFVIRIT